MTKHLLLLLLIFAAMPLVALSQFNDAVHYSPTFERDKDYRIFYPSNYQTAISDSFPVVYFLHGWGGSHTQDPSAKINHELVRQMVENSSAILVMWNGRSVETADRPYNIGYHEHVVCQTQMKDYFLELVAHIDTTYRVFSNREKRATMGFSMGGFMSFYLAGKYPHMINTAVNVVGSAEFYMGYPSNHTLYSHRFTMGNLHGVNLRFHNSTSGQLVYLNSEVHKGALREKGLNYLYKQYPGGHQFNEDNSNANLQEAYNWVLSSFSKPVPEPTRWNHVDIYPQFMVWDYWVNSNLNEPGFIVLKGVTNHGMQISTKLWLPNGPVIPNVTNNVKTAPIYEPNSLYTILDYNKSTNSILNTPVTSNSEGIVAFAVSGDIHNIGIVNTNSPAEIVVIDYTIDNSKKFLKQGEQGSLKLKLFNRGGKSTSNLQIKLSTQQSNVIIHNATATVSQLNSGDTVVVETSFDITANYDAPTDASPFSTRVNVEFTDELSNKWFDEFDVPIFFTLPEFYSIRIDDGIQIADKIYGKGNANGIADPGETIMIFKTSKQYRLYSNDPYVQVHEEKLNDQALPAVWYSDGITLSSIVKIADNCPVGHTINFMGAWEYKENNPIKRKVFWDNIPITVGGIPDANSIKKKNSIKVYPNPAEEYITIANPDNLDNLSIRIINTKGEIVLQRLMLQNTMQVDVSTLSKGIYIIRVFNNEFNIHHKLVLSKAIK